MKELSIKNILVPIDFSKMSIQAIETAKGLAQRFGATVHLGRVHEFEYPAGFIGPVFSAGGLPESFEEHRRKALAEDLSNLARRPGLSPAGATTCGRAHRRLMKFAASRENFLPTSL
jgi:nucleotide-binding universal stress UspA family protein